MGGFLRMQAFRKTTSDEEFIESVGRELARRPRRRAGMLAVGFGLILLGILWLAAVPNLLHARLSTQQPPPLKLAVGGGTAAGAAGAVFLLMGVRLLGEGTGGGRRDRMARMLLECQGRGGGPEADPPGLTDQ